MSSELSPERPRPAAAVVFFAVLFVTSFAVLGYLLWGYLTDLVLGLMTAGICYPLYRRVLRWVRGRKWLASTAVTGVVAVSVALPAFLLVTNLSQQAASAYVAARDAISLEAAHEQLFGDGWLARQARYVFQLAGQDYSPETVGSALGQLAGAVARFFSEQLNALLSNLLAAAYHFAIMLLIVFYGLIDGPLLKRRILQLSPLPDAEEELIISKFKDVGRAILFGNGIGSALQGALGGFAMWVAGLPSPVFWGAVMAIFAFLPLVGISVVVVPASVYLAVKGRWVAALTFFIVCMLVALVVENVVKTRLIGGHMRIHNLLIFLSLIAGLSIFGILGILYGPLVVVLFLTVTELYEQHYRDRIMSR